MIRFLHISDIHYDLNSKVKTIALAKSLNSFLKSLEDKNNGVNFIVCSGDMINQGGKSFNDIATAFKDFRDNYVTTLLDGLNLTNDRLVFCCGNHDVDREEDLKEQDDFLWSSLVSENDVDDLFSHKQLKKKVRRIAEYVKFEYDYYNTTPLSGRHSLSYIGANHVYELENCKIGFASLNSSWRCYDSNTDKGRLVIGNVQINNAIDDLTGCDIKIVVSHHSCDFLREFDSHVCEKNLNKNFDIHFCGHTHCCEPKYTQTPSSIMFSSRASGLLTRNLHDDEFHIGFTIVEYDLDSATVKTTYYKPDKDWKFIQNLEIEGLDANGVWEVPMLRGEEREKACLLSDFRYVRIESLPELNADVLSYKAESNAPQELDRIFVMPVITDQLFDNYEKSSCIEHLEQFVKDNQNTIVFGKKESGKTILLDKLYSDVLRKKIGDGTRLCLKIKYNDIQKGIINLLRDKLNKNRTYTEAILKEYGMYLFIDDFDINKEKQERTLTSFLQEYPKVQVIATSLVLFSEDVPLSSSLQNVFNFKSYELKPFRSKQITALTKKWFGDEDNDKTHSTVRSIVKMFQSLNLPNTPLIVSMFLSLIEKMGKYMPQNDAIMIENFIENLLDKRKNNPKKKEFDYGNKVDLLSDIAFGILTDEDGDGVSLPSYKVVEIITRYLQDCHFESLYKSTTILDSFYTKGILIEDHNYVTFRFNCFFEYFLVKKMEADEAFRVEVTNKFGLLKFANEIRLYTGLHRGEGQILRDTIDLMNEVFKNLINMVFFTNSIDRLFYVPDLKVLQSVIDVDKIAPAKLNEDDSNRNNDAQLFANEHREHRIVCKKEPEGFARLQISLMLAMNVLRNSENVRESNLKETAYRQILTATIAYAAHAKLLLEKILTTNFDKPLTNEFKLQLKMMIRFMPMLHYKMMEDNIGSYKLSEIYKGKIDEDILKETVSAFEQFISVMLLFSVKGIESKDNLLFFIKKCNKRYIIENSQLVLLLRYIDTTNTDEENLILDLLSDLRSKVKGIDKGCVKERLIQMKKESRSDRLSS